MSQSKWTGEDLPSALRQMSRLRPTDRFHNSMHARLMGEQLAMVREGRKRRSAGWFNPVDVSWAARFGRGILVLPTPRAWAAALVVLVLAVAFGGFYATQFEPHALRVANVYGNIVLKSEDSVRTGLIPGMAIPQGATLITDEGALVDLTLSEDLTFEIVGATQMSFVSLPSRPWMKGIAIDMASGTLLVRSQNQADRKDLSLVVTTPQAVVEPVGTVFGVTVDPEEKTRVLVTEGKVLVEQRGFNSHLFVRSGEYVLAIDGVSEMARLPIDRGSDPLCRLLEGFENREWADRMVMGRIPAHFVDRVPTVYLDIGPGHNPTRLERLMQPCDILTNIQHPQELWELLHDASYMLKLGIMHQRPAHLERSLGLIDEVLHSYSNEAYNMELMLWKASLHNALGKPQQALQDLEAALASPNIGPFKSLVYSAMAKIHEDMANIEQAKAFYGKVIKEGANSPEYELALQKVNSL